MKFTPFVIFLILLFVFVGLYISMMNNKNEFQIQAYNEKKLSKYEGFIDFKNNISTNTIVNIPQYSDTNSVVKLYDNIYFDNTNGNLIEIDGLEVSGNSKDETGATIQNLYITTRDDPTNVNIYSINGEINDMNIDDSYIKKVSDSYVAYSYQNQSSASSQSVTFYTAWQDLTCINVFSNTVNVNNNNGTPLNSINLLQNYLCLPGKTPEYNYIQTTDFIDSNVPYYNDTDTNNNTFVVLPLYNPNVQVYQISHFVYFDVSIGYLILVNGDGTNSITVYDSIGGQVNMNTPSSAMTSSTDQVNMGCGSGIITPGVVKEEKCPSPKEDKVMKCPDIVIPAASAAPAAPSNVNMQIDGSQIANMFGTFAKPFLSCLANTANSEFTVPPVADFRSNFAKAFILEYPGYGYDKAYDLADKIYQMDIPYYKAQPDDGTAMGNIIGKKTYIIEISTSPNQSTTTPAISTSYSTATSMPTMTPINTPATRTATTAANTASNTAANTASNTTANTGTSTATETFTSSIADFNPYMVVDTFGQNVIIYNQINSVDTIVIIGGYSDATNRVFEIINAVRFVDAGVDTGSVSTQQNNYVNPNNMINSNNYYLSAQIPQMYNSICSLCNGINNGNCPNCGGNGGSGTMTSNGLSMVDNTNYQQLWQQQRQPQPLNNVADVPIANSGTSSFIPILDDFSRFGR